MSPHTSPISNQARVYETCGRAAVAELLQPTPTSTPNSPYPYPYP